MPHSPEHLDRLVADRHVHPSVYSDPELFEMEMELIYDRAWLLVGHESQIATPGSFVTTRAGRHPILLWRDKTGAVRGFLNRCPHRGVRLCSLDRGSARSLVCPYHGWVFADDGSLQSLPSPEEYGADFSLGDYGLAPVAALDRYRGFIFVRHVEDGPDLLDFLGEMKSSIDDLVDRAPDGEIEICPVPLRHRYRGNWKLGFENLNDSHHARVTHAATVRAATRVMRELGDGGRHGSLYVMKANGMPINLFSQLELVTERYGHSYIHGFIDGQKKTVFPDAYMERMTANKGVAETERILSVSRHLTLLYPSATLQGRFGSMRLIHPIRPDLTEISGYIFRLKGAPEEMFEEALHYFHISISPFSPVATDDLEIYEGAQDLSNSRLAPRYPVTRGLNGAEAESGANRVPATSEAFIRNQYESWKTYMSAGMSAGAAGAAS